MATWAMNIYDMAGSSVLSPAPFHSAAVRWVRNSPGALDGEFAYTQVSFDDLRCGEREIKITRDASVVWGGYLASRGKSERGQRRTHFSAEGYFAHLRRRFVTNSLAYVAEPQEDIVAGLISYAMGQADG